MFALVDCNNFYISCERIFSPTLKNRPAVVLSNNDGCIVARSNEAKVLGIKMGVPAFKIENVLRDNNVAVFSSNYALYGDISDRVMSILTEHAPNIEIYSIDEAFLDVANIPLDRLVIFARGLQTKIKRWTGIPVSIGIAPTKTLAKVANKLSKKNSKSEGLFIISEEKKIEEVLSTFPVEDIWGIGRQYSRSLRSYGITTALELRNMQDEWIRKIYTVVGLRIAEELRGTSCMMLEPIRSSKKEICTSCSFGKTTTDISLIREAVSTYTSRCAEKLRRQKTVANLITVFIETNPFKPELPQYNKSRTIHITTATNNTIELLRHALFGLESIFREGYNYKKAGIIVSGLTSENFIQNNLFDEVGKISRDKFNIAAQTLDRLNKIMGRDVVRYAAQGVDRVWRLRQERLTQCYTTQWNDLLTINI